MPNERSEVVRVVLSLDTKTAEFIEKARRSAGLFSKQQWIYMAISAYRSKWRPPTANKTMWEPCSICGKPHDRDDHFRKSG